MTADLYREHGPGIFRYALHKLGRREDAEDATQATFANAYSALSTGTAVREPRAWLFQIARHECLTRVTDRRERTVPLDHEWEPADERPGVERQADTQRTVRDVLAAVAALPETQRDALVLREWSGLSTAEVAEALGTTVSSVDALLHRARRSVLASVAGHDEAAGCRQTRDRLDSGRLDLAARAHLVRCAECRSLREQLLPAPAGGFTLVPPAILAERLGDLIPGFASGSGAAAIGAGAAASGGGVAAIIGKVAALPAAAKISVAIAGSAVVVGGTVVEGARVLDAPTAPAPAAIVQVEEAAAAQSTPAAALSPAVTQPIGLTESSDDHGGGGSNSGPGGGGSDDYQAEDAPRGDDHSGLGRGGSDDGPDDTGVGSSGKGGGGDDGAREESQGSDNSGRGRGDDGAGDAGGGSSGTSGRAGSQGDGGGGTSGKDRGGEQADERRDVDVDKPSGDDRIEADDSRGSGKSGGSGGGDDSGGSGGGSASSGKGGDAD